MRPAVTAILMALISTSGCSTATKVANRCIDPTIAIAIVPCPSPYAGCDDSANVVACDVYKW